jgi:catechol 2,3-dioxygenase
VKVQQLGHVVLKVRERERSERFYTEVLGLQIAARRDTPPMTFFTLGNHHDFAIVAVGAYAPDSPADRPRFVSCRFQGRRLDR